MDFAATVTETALWFMAPDGKTYRYNAITSQSTFGSAVQLIKQIQSYTNVHRSNLALIEQLILLISPKTPRKTGKVTVQDGKVLYNGESVGGRVSENILWGMNLGIDMTPTMLFLDKLQQNPSERAVGELFTFIATHRIVIADDGDLLAYKKVSHDFKDLYTHTIDNSPGATPEMPRDLVDANYGKQCAQGLHCCSFEYLPNYRSEPGHKVVLVKINPKDVVCVPVDVTWGKLRVCCYSVEREIPYEQDKHATGDVKDELQTKPVWTHDDINPVVPLDEVGRRVRFVGFSRTLGTGDVYTVDGVHQWGTSKYVRLKGIENSVYPLDEFEGEETVMQQMELRIARKEHVE